MSENFNIQSIHGSYFTAEICFTDVVGRISVRDDATVYLCQDKIHGSYACRDFLGHKCAWFVGDMTDLAGRNVFNLKILPSPIEYHALFQEILEKRGPAWNEDGSYSVIPNEVLAKIRSFVEGIKEFDAKNVEK